MSNKTMDNPTYIASCSFGKDSIATILLAMENNEPLDRIVSVEVMFDNKRGISGEHPEHIQWVKEVAIPRLKELTGIDTDIIRNEKDDYLTIFYHKITNKSKNIERVGKYQGFPLGGMYRIQRDLKIRPICEYFKQFESYIQYLGIAANEPKRLARLDGIKKVSLLAKYGYGEQMAYNLCAKYNLLSPLYKISTRGGCWFCPNSGIREFCKFRQNHPSLWNELRELANVKNKVSDGFRYGLSFSEIEKQIESYDRQLTIF